MKGIIVSIRTNSIGTVSGCACGVSARIQANEAKATTMNARDIILPQAIWER
jgi:hypothetical protein